jgi:hypothetical protein
MTKRCAAAGRASSQIKLCFLISRGLSELAFPASKSALSSEAMAVMRNTGAHRNAVLFPIHSRVWKKRSCGDL